MLLFVGESRKDEKVSETAYTFLETTLQGLCPESPLPPLSRSPQGKPFYEGLSWQFNLSHSKDFFACALDQSPVGVDIQIHKPHKSHNPHNPRKPGLSPKLIQRVCSPQEQAWLAQYPQGFSLLWAMKEAYFKWNGEGIGGGKKLALTHLPLPQWPTDRTPQQLVGADCFLWVWRFSSCSLVLCTEENQPPLLQWADLGQHRTIPHLQLSSKIVPQIR